MLAAYYFPRIFIRGGISDSWNGKRKVGSVNNKTKRKTFC